MKKNEQIAELIDEVESLKIKNQDLLDLTVRFGCENQRLKQGIQEIIEAANNTRNAYSSGYAINNHLSGEARQQAANSCQYSASIDFKKVVDRVLSN